MFETTVVESRKKKRGMRGALTLPVSIAAHLVAVGASMFATVWVVDFPSNSPSQFSTYSLVEPPPPPPPPPPAARPQQVIKRVVIPKELLNTAPTVIPDTIPDVIEEPVIEEGIEGGIEGGTEGGVVEVEPPPVALPPPPPPPPVDAPLEVGGEVVSPELTYSPAPSYPEVAQRARLDGSVLVELVIDKQGNVDRIVVVSSDSELFENAALEAVKRWRFKPGRKGKEAVETVSKWRVNFEMVSNTRKKK